MTDTTSGHTCSVDGRGLPVDSDLEVAETSTGAPRPVHLRWRYLGLVLIGGSVGTAARYLLTEVLPVWRGIPLGTIMINVIGAFALGVLLEILARRGPDQGMRRTLRLLIGTGLLGGFTTYSSLAVDTDGLLASDQIWHSILYAAATLAIGAIASTAGILAGASSHGWRPTRATFNLRNRGARR
ncbi:CrcB protein [Cryobacterium sp. CAN_C3]|uniref:fluoride efflux transporter CrcB n=1 Tax=unclassified Cryobacterium TaxID=2649013 RepID=UPI001A1FFA50|nr:CrcB protein [Cryobacterium sp. CAN_C3]